MTRALLVVPLISLLGCGPDLVRGTFTSRVVQLEVCTVRGDRPETCEQAETLLDLQVELEEREDDDVWLRGIPRGGVSDRAILGSRDDDGGFLFVEETLKSNADTGCSVTERVELSLAIDPDVAPEKVGADACTALVGREYVLNVSTSDCDAINDPPLDETRIARRRWERSPLCKDD